MKVPNDLPWLKSDFMVGDFFNTEEVKYAQAACNNFPKAIELLESITESELNTTDIVEFLNSLENDI